jgi:hypothetical protein
LAEAGRRFRSPLIGLRGLLQDRLTQRPNWLIILQFIVYYQYVIVYKKSAKKNVVESVERIEPAHVEEPTEAISDFVAELSAAEAIG